METMDENPNMGIFNVWATDHIKQWFFMEHPCNAFDLWHCFLCYFKERCNTKRSQVPWDIKGINTIAKLFDDMLIGCL